MLSNDSQSIIVGVAMILVLEWVRQDTSVKRAQCTLSTSPELSTQCTQTTVERWRAMRMLDTSAGSAFGQRGAKL